MRSNPAISMPLPLLGVGLMLLLWRGDALFGSGFSFSSSSSNRHIQQRRSTHSLEEGSSSLLLLSLSPSDYFGDPATIMASSMELSSDPGHLHPPEMGTTTVASPLLSPPPSPSSSDSSTSTTTSPPAKLGKVQRLGNLADFLHCIDSAPIDSLVVIKFFGHSCPLCRKIEMRYKKMAYYYGSVAPIAFTEIEKRSHPDLFTTLGIETFPYIQIYRNGQCVASHGTESDTTFEPIVKDTIERELTMSLDDWNAFLTAFAVPIQASTAKLEILRAQLSTA